MSALFHVLEGDAVILFRKGTFRQSEVYQRKGELYAKHAGGFIRLMDGGGTSVPGVVWEDLQTTAKHERGAFGRLVLK